MHQVSGSVAEYDLPPDGISLAHWERASREAVAQAREGQIVLALGGYQRALAIALELIKAPTAGRAEDCVAALVVSHHNLADLKSAAGCVDGAIRHLCSAHETLFGIVLAPAPAQDACLQQAALRHSRKTYVALLHHVATYGPHALIARALRTGELALIAGGSMPH